MAALAREAGFPGVVGNTAAGGRHPALNVTVRTERGYLWAEGLFRAGPSLCKPQPWLFLLCLQDAFSNNHQETLGRGKEAKQGALLTSFGGCTVPPDGVGGGRSWCSVFVGVDSLGFGGFSLY